MPQYVAPFNTSEVEKTIENSKPDTNPQEFNDNVTNYTVVTKTTIRPATEVITSNINSLEKSPINFLMFESLTNKFSSSNIETDKIKLEDDGDKNFPRENDENKRTHLNKSISIRPIDPLIKKENEECFQLVNSKIKELYEVFLKFGNNLF